MPPIDIFQAEVRLRDKQRKARIDQAVRNAYEAFYCRNHFDFIIARMRYDASLIDGISTFMLDEIKYQWKRLEPYDL